MMHRWITATAVASAVALPAFGQFITRPADDAERHGQRWFKGNLVQVDTTNHTVTILKGKFEGSGAQGKPGDAEKVDKGVEVLCRIKPIDTHCHFKGNARGLTIWQIKDISRSGIEIPVKAYYSGKDTIPTVSSEKALELLEMVFYDKPIQVEQ